MAANGTAAPGTEPAVNPRTADIKVPDGVILPPPDLRTRIEKTAQYVGTRAVSFERQLTATPDTAAKFPFAFEDNPFYPYFRWRTNEVRQGRGGDGSFGTKSAAHKSAAQGPPEPQSFRFSARMPLISAVDLDIIKTTAIFVAKLGRPWMISLSQKENTNPQFNFLRPTHTLHGFFTLLTDQYKTLLSGADLNARTARIRELHSFATDKSAILGKARDRAEWFKHKSEAKEKAQATKEAEERAYREIDWQDFVVVGTIEFTEADDDVELPAPTTLAELQTASLEQKAAFSIPVDRRLEETRPDDDFFFNDTQTQAQPSSTIVAPATAAVQQYAPGMPAGQYPHPQAMYYPQYPVQSHYPAQYPPSYSPSPYNMPQQPQVYPPPATSPVGGLAQSLYPAMPGIPANTATAPSTQPAPPGTSPSPAPGAAPGTGAGPAPMRIRNDYIPRAQAKRQIAATVLCAICNQQILESEYANHLKIEQLDPTWRAQNASAAQNRSGAGAGLNNAAADVARNLKRLASQRSADGDATDGAAPDASRKKIELEATASAGPGGAVGPAAAAATQRPTDVQEQIRQLQTRYANN